MIVKGLFNKHLRVRHSLLPFRCLMKDCGQHFDQKIKLGHHIRQSHRLTQWPCGKCCRQFSTYGNMVTHNSIIHQRGHFECSVANCTFTAEYRRIVINHYRHVHLATYL